MMIVASHIDLAATSLGASDENWPTLICSWRIAEAASGSRPLDAICATLAQRVGRAAKWAFSARCKSDFAQTNGIRTHYVTLGSGPLLIRLHGWPQTWFAWRDVMPRLGKRFTVVAPDLRGTGLSERTGRATTSARSPKTCAR
jgi:hypothetical protein